MLYSYYFLPEFSAMVFSCMSAKIGGQQENHSPYTETYLLFQRTCFAFTNSPTTYHFHYSIDNHCSSTMLQSSQFPRPPAFEQRDDTPTYGYAGQNAPQGTSGSFRSIVKSANAGLQRGCNTLGSINLNIQQSAVLNSVGGKLATLRNAATTSSMNVNKDDQGIFSGQSTASWGSVKENVSTFASKKVVPILNSNPLRTAAGGFGGDHRSQVEVSFNYQLMSDE